jgi:hypothetical protein
MNDRLPDREENPVASGIVALLAVAVVVGILAGIGALAATRWLGIDGSSELGGGEPGQGDSLYMPKPRKTAAATGPLVTLAPSDTVTGIVTDVPTETFTEDETVNSDPNLSLTVGSTSVAAGEELMLSGTYVGGEGSVLDIYYNVNGVGWEEFPLDTNVSGGIFQTFVATWKTGRVEWRVQDESSGRRSNTVTVQIA